MGRAEKAALENDVQSARFGNMLNAENMNSDKEKRALGMNFKGLAYISVLKESAQVKRELSVPWHAATCSVDTAIGGGSKGCQPDHVH